LHVFADHADYVGLLLYPIRECSSFRQRRFPSRLRRLASGGVADNFGGRAETAKYIFQMRRLRSLGPG
jgi:hypothetical protein